MTLDQLRKYEREKVRQAGGRYEVTEGDWWQNKISRAIIRAMRKEKGAAWIGSVNLYGEDRKRPYHLTEYRRGMVYNFSASFVVPTNDLILTALIEERDQSTYEGTGADYKRVTEIYDRIEAIGGEGLRWV